MLRILEVNVLDFRRYLEIGIPAVAVLDFRRY
jgi:hypothetical protein